MSSPSETSAEVSADIEGLRAALPPDTEVATAPFDVDGTRPALAARPTTPEQVATILRSASERGVAVVPQGGRTALSLGRPLSHYDLALDTSGLNAVIEYAPDDLTITVQAGLTLRSLQAVLGEYGQYLSVDPPPDDRVTVGGLLATARSGAWRGHLPAARDLVLGATVAMADGALATSGGRVVKNVSGFDLHRLHTGALGSLGVIVAASFKVAPQPDSHRSLLLACSSTTDAGTLARALWDLNLAVRAITILGPQAAEAIELAALPAILVEFAGVEAATTDSVGRATELARESGASVNSTDDSLWTKLRSLGGESSESPEFVVARAGVPTTSVAALVEQAESQDFAAWGHVAAGAVWMRSTEAGAPQITALRTSSEAVQGFLQIESAPRSLREQIDPFGETERELVRSLKARFDATGTINPGRWMVGV
jgi:glycolate oxidase FAD binding subunit